VISYDSVVTQVYKTFLRRRSEDKQVSIKDVLSQEPYASQISQGIFNERELEKSVQNRLLQEEESGDIQKMIAQFYNKFDELHEQSLTAALSKNSDKQSLKNEIKYHIPQRWTKNFHKYDIVSMDIYKDSAVTQERGRVNRDKVVQRG
jgi:uncharacterized membrane protein YheB (UPF0754 family)